MHMILCNFQYYLLAQAKYCKNCLGVGTNALGCEFCNRRFTIICLFFLLSFSMLFK